MKKRADKRKGRPFRQSAMSRKVTKNRGREKSKFFVKKEEFLAKTALKADVAAQKNDKILHKPTRFVQKFSHFLLHFSFQTLSDGVKKQSDFFTRLSFFQKNLSRIFKAMSPIFEKSSHRIDCQLFNKLSEYSKIFGQRLFLSEFSNLSNVNVKIFRNGWVRRFSATDEHGWTRIFVLQRMNTDNSW